MGFFDNAELKESKRLYKGEDMLQEGFKNVVGM